MNESQYLHSLDKLSKTRCRPALGAVGEPLELVAVTARRRQGGA